MPTVRVSSETKIMLEHAQQYLEIAEPPQLTLGEIVRQSVDSWLYHALKDSQDPNEEPDQSIRDKTSMIESSLVENGIVLQP